MKVPISLLLAVIIIACNKNDEDAGDSNRFQLLINKKWQVRSNISIDSMNRQTDLFSQLASNKKDDFLLFNSDSTYELNDNLELQADSTSRILDSGHWHLSDDNLQLLRTSDMYVREFEPAMIRTLTADKLIIQSDFAADRSSVITEFSAIP